MHDQLEHLRDLRRQDWARKNEHVRRARFISDVMAYACVITGAVILINVVLGLVG